MSARRTCLAFALWFRALLCLWRHEYFPPTQAPARPRRRFGGAVLMRKVRGLGLAAVVVGATSVMQWAEIQRTRAKVEHALLLALLAQPRVLAPAPAPNPTPGDYNYLRPVTPAGDELVLAGDMYFDSTTGTIRGSAWDTSAPTWARTTTLTLTNSASDTSNMTDLNAKIVSELAGITGHTRILIPIANYKGSCTLPANLSGYWIGLYTVDYASLPDESPGDDPGTYANRVSPSDAAHMPTFYNSATNERVIFGGTNTRNYYVRGIALTNPGEFQNSGMIYIYPANPSPGVAETDATKFPRDIVLSQLYVNTNNRNKVERVIYMGGERTAIVDSYAHEFGLNSVEGQFMALKAGAGPHRCHNNYAIMSGSGENFMVGGTTLPDTSSDALLPKHIEISGNFFDKYTDGSHRNQIEVKHGLYITIYNNRCGFANGGIQYFAIVIKLNDQNGPNTHVDVHDVVIMNNWITQGPGGISVTGWEGTAGTGQTFLGPLQPRRVFIANNLSTTVGTANSSADSGLRMEGARIEDIVAIYNTFVVPATGQVRSAAMAFTGTPASSWKQGATLLKYNVMAAAEGADKLYCLKGTNTNSGGTTALNTFCSSYVFEENLTTTGADSRYTLQYQVADQASVGFVDKANGNYRLGASSVGYQAGPDGQDLGYQWAVFEAEQAKVAA